jgi:hypothetical protein
MQTRAKSGEVFKAACHVADKAFGVGGRVSTITS